MPIGLVIIISLITSFSWANSFYGDNFCTSTKRIKELRNLDICQSSSSLVGCIGLGSAALGYTQTQSAKKYLKNHPQFDAQLKIYAEKAFEAWKDSYEHEPEYFDYQIKDRIKARKARLKDDVARHKRKLSKSKTSFYLGSTEAGSYHRLEKDKIEKLEAKLKKMQNNSKERALLQKVDNMKLNYSELNAKHKAEFMQKAAKLWLVDENKTLLAKFKSSRKYMKASMAQKNKWINALKLLGSTTASAAGAVASFVVPQTGCGQKFAPYVNLDTNCKFVYKTNQLVKDFIYSDDQNILEGLKHHKVCDYYKKLHKEKFVNSLPKFKKRTCFNDKIIIEVEKYGENYQHELLLHNTKLETVLTKAEGLWRHATHFSPNSPEILSYDSFFEIASEKEKLLNNKHNLRENVGKTKNMIRYEKFIEDRQKNTLTNQLASDRLNPANSKISQQIINMQSLYLDDLVACTLHGAKARKSCNKRFTPCSNRDSKAIRTPRNQKRRGRKSLPQ